MTDLLKAYAHQVASYHPAAARDDLYSEVYDELCEEFKDWIAENPGLEEADFLDAEREHPMKLATRMAGERQAYLVGPTLYFSFLTTLKSVLAIVVVMNVGLVVLRVFTGDGIVRAALGMAVSIPEALLWASAAVLGVFIALERSGEQAKWLDSWSSANLRNVDSHPGDLPLRDQFRPGVFHVRPFVDFRHHPIAPHGATRRAVGQRLDTPLTRMGLVGGRFAAGVRYRFRGLSPGSNAMDPPTEGHHRRRQPVVAVLAGFRHHEAGFVFDGTRGRRRARPVGRACPARCHCGGDCHCYVGNGDTRLAPSAAPGLTGRWNEGNNGVAFVAP